PGPALEHRPHDSSLVASSGVIDGGGTGAFPRPPSSRIRVAATSARLVAEMHYTGDWRNHARTMELLTETERPTENFRESSTATSLDRDDRCGCVYVAEAGVWTVICADHEARGAEPSRASNDLSLAP